MRLTRKLLFVAFVLLNTGVHAQIQDFINKTHRELLGNPTRSTRLDTIIFRHAVVTDSIIAAIQNQGYASVSCDLGLSACIDAAAASTTAKFIIVTTAQTISVNDTLPADVGLFILNGGSINVAAGKTFLIQGSFFSPNDLNIFTGSGNVVFSPGTVSQVYPEWWGAKADSTGDSGPAIKKAFTAVPTGAVIELSAGGRTLNAPQGYIINTTVRVPSDKNVTVNGNGAVIYSSATDTLFLIQNGSQTSVPSYAMSPTTLQPRHIFNNMRFRRIAGATGTGVAIACVNSTAQTFNNIDVADYNNAFVFHNISDGWCENNEIFNSRIAGCDTAISYMLSQSGNNSMATNSLRKVTITRFTDSDVINQGAGQAVGIYGDTGTNLYRNVWDQVTIFPKDSVTCVNIDGKAEDLTGTINFEYIGATSANRMRGFHFGTSANELRFKLHVNLTGRVYFPDGQIFYSQIPGSFGYSGITTSFSGGNNHGNEVMVDSSKFTPLFGVMRNNNRMTKNTQSDSARIFFANVNNTGAGKLDIRARRNATIEIRSITDNLYSGPTANSSGNSSLPLQPVRLLDIGTNRTMNNAGVATDSTVVDVRNTTYLLFGSGTSVVDTLKAFKGGLTGQTLDVQFLDDSTIVGNLVGASGSGRLFLKGNKSLRSVTGLRMQFKAETETNGVFWRERWREFPEQVITVTDNDPTPDVSLAVLLRVANTAPTTITNFLTAGGSISGRAERMVTLRFTNGNTTVQSNANIILNDATDFVGAANDALVLQFDESESKWVEISRTSPTALGSAAGVTSPTDVTINADDDNTDTGDIIMKVGTTEVARVRTSNNFMGIKTATPDSGLTVGRGIKTNARQVIDRTYVEYWGAVSDSLTDNTTAFQNAINDAAYWNTEINLSNGGTGYLINNTVRIPTGKQIRINGHGAKIYSSTSDTIFAMYHKSSSTGSARLVRNKISDIRFGRIAGSARGGSMAIALVNVVNQVVEDCDFGDFNKAVTVSNTVVGGVAGWNEACHWERNRFVGNDTSIKFQVYGAATNSFATHRFISCDFTGAPAGTISASSVYYAQINGSSYRQTFIGTTMFLDRYVTGMYLGGESKNMWGQLNFEITGSLNKVGSRAFHFASTATNLIFNLYCDFSGRRRFDDIIQNDAADPVQGIFTRWQGQDSNLERGYSQVVEPSKLVRIESLADVTAFDDSTASPSTTTAYLYGRDLKSDGKTAFRSQAGFNFVRYDPADYMGYINAHVTGTARTVNDSNTVDVRNTKFLTLGSVSAAFDTLKRFTGGVEGQELFLFINNDNIPIAHNVPSGTAGRLKLVGDQSLRAMAGNIFHFIYRTSSGDERWIQTVPYIPMATLNQNSSFVDSLNVASKDFIRLNTGVSTSLKNLYGGYDGQIVTFFHRDANTTVYHNSGSGTGRILLINSTSPLTPYSGRRDMFQYDASDDNWRQLNHMRLGEEKNVDLTGASAGAILRLRSNGVWVDSSLAVASAGGWTKATPYATVDSDVSEVRVGGANNNRQIWYDADGDTVRIRPQAAVNSYWFEYKDGATTLLAADTSGVLRSNTFTNISAGPLTLGEATVTAITVTTDGTGDGEVVLPNQSVGSAEIAPLVSFLTKPDMIEFLGGAMQATASSGASDTTQFYKPVKAFSVGDTATFDWAVSKRFTFIDSVVVLGWSNTAASNVVLNFQLRQVLIGGAVGGAFNAASSKTISTGTAGTLRQWSFTSFGTLSGSALASFTGKLYRTSGGTGGDLFVERVIIYGVGLR